ncbi:ribonuclease HII [Bacteroidota bacterium]
MLKPFHTPGIIEAGCDEAGRGCLAGPVFAAAVILPENTSIEELDDSKKLNATKRNLLRKIIEEKAISYAVAMVLPDKIDEINILNASILAMHRALNQLRILPAHILVDGNKFKPYKEIAHHCIIKGDGIYQSIAAASILAKTYRDSHMEELHRLYPEYKWSSNKGYPTRAHREAIRKLGPTPQHRRSFRLTDDQLQISFS